MSDSLWPHGLSPARLLISSDSPGKNTGVGSHSLLQGTFLIKPGFPALQTDSWLSEPPGLSSYQGSPDLGRHLTKWIPTQEQVPCIWGFRRANRTVLRPFVPLLTSHEIIWWFTSFTPWEFTLFFCFDLCNIFVRWYRTITFYRFWPRAIKVSLSKPMYLLSCVVSSSKSFILLQVCPPSTLHWNTELI